MRVLFVHNQHFQDSSKFYFGMASYLENHSKIKSEFLFWKKNDILLSTKVLKKKNVCHSFEQFIETNHSKIDLSVEDFVKKFPNINWSQIIASERAFTDYSMLQGGTGNRLENIDYIQNLVIKLSNFIILHLKNKTAVVCQTADTLLTHILFKLADHYNVRIYAIVPSLIYEGNKGGGFFANNENLRSNLMIKNYQKLFNYKFSKKDLLRLKNFKKNIIGFKNKNPFIDKMKGQNVGKNAFTPKLTSVVSYLYKNSKLNKDIFYTKIDPIRKIKANFLRFIRKYEAKIFKLYGTKNIEDLPEKNVFFAMHFQPEQSTLTQGIWSVNQVALIENISKSLPMNYTLIVKEHSWGRGSRPNWQYRHLSNLHNVYFSDAPTQKIIEKTDAVISITGSILIETLILDKPAIMFGKNFFDYSDLIHKVDKLENLPRLLYDILIKRKILSKSERKKQLDRFILSFMNSQILSFPLEENSAIWGKSLLKELSYSR